MDTENPIVKKIMLTGEVEADSPLHIGSGRAETTDMDIIRDCQGKPFIPATSLVGVLRHAFPKEFQNRPSFKTFWGYSEQEKGRQSALCCDDLIIDDSKQSCIVSVRDGVKIDGATGCAEEKGKFDLELVNKGARFDLSLEITVRKNDKETARYARTVYELLSSGIALGAKTNNGLGKIRLVGNTGKIRIFDFARKEDVRDWLLQDFSGRSSRPEDLGEPFPIEKKKCHLRASLRLKHALLVRSYSHKPEMPDAVQLQSGDNWILPGSSIRGALRARAERIVNTLADKQNKKNYQQFLKSLFGYVNDDTKKKKKGRLKIDDVCLARKNFAAELHTRIRVDRFTGGVINGALFDSMPVYAGEKSVPVDFSFTVTNYEDADIGLLLLLLKDLWTGDLAIGGEKNIGRGVFKGVSAEIAWGDRKISIKDDPATLEDEDRKTLQNFVDHLHNLEKTA